MGVSIRSATAPIEVRRLGTVDYEKAWELQRELADARVAGGPDTLLLLQHPSVYTAGRRTLPDGAARSTTPLSSTPTGAARSPGTGPDSWSAIRSSAWPNRWMW